MSSTLIGFVSDINPFGQQQQTNFQMLTNFLLLVSCQGLTPGVPAVFGNGYFGSITGGAPGGWNGLGFKNKYQLICFDQQE